MVWLIQRQKRNYKVTKAEENEHFPQYVLCIKLQLSTATELTSTLIAMIISVQSTSSFRPQPNWNRMPGQLWIWYNPHHWLGGKVHFSLYRIERQEKSWHTFLYLMPITNGKMLLHSVEEEFENTTKMRHRVMGVVKI